MQPVSRGWIGLDAESRRDDTPIRQISKSISQKRKKLQINAYASSRTLHTLRGYPIQGFLVPFSSLISDRQKVFTYNDEMDDGNGNVIIGYLVGK